MAHVTMALKLSNFEKCYRVQINFGYSTNVFRNEITKQTKIPIDCQRIVFKNQMVCDETANIQYLKECMDANKEDGDVPVEAVIINVAKTLECDPTKLQVLQLMNKLSLYQTEQQLAYTTMANQNNMQNMQNMMSRLQSSAKQVFLYEDKNMQIAALKVIPVVDLYNRAMKSENPKTSFNDELCAQLLAWFKHRFFSWTNKPSCKQCKGSTNFIGGGQPNAEEIAGQAGRVEVYQCDACNVTTRFPRYNNPVKLLETKTGRCGEWANCFTLCCRSIGLEARYVSDWTDHVWTEVYSPSLSRWLHCDSCENRMDAPLLYESGWGKKLNYVIAFSKDEVVDVTRRYTNKLNEVMGRRNLVAEPWLKNLILVLDRKQRTNVFQTVERCEELGRRRLIETKHFVDGPNSLDRNKEAEMCGRISGDVAWRSQRNELGDGIAKQRALEESSTPLTSLQNSAAKIPKTKNCVRKISVRAGNLIDCITFFDESNEILCKAGTDGGELHEEFVLNADEYIVKITQKYGDSLDSVCFYTNNGRFKKYGGNGGSNVQNFTVGENERIIGVERSTNFCGKIIKILTQKKDDEKKEKASGVEESKQ
jgi:hypothetical protein